MDVISQYSLIPYEPLKAVVPAGGRSILPSQPEVYPLISGHRLLNYDSSTYSSKTVDLSPLRVYTSGSRLSPIEPSNIGSFIDVYT